MSPKVLIAEDYLPMRETMAVLVNRSEFAVVGSAATGLEALRLTAELAPDVLLIDVLMPVLDGRDVVRQLKERACQTKVVFVSACLAPDVLDSCLQAGGDAYVVKMRMATDLIPAIRAVLVGKKFVSLL